MIVILKWDKSYKSYYLLTLIEMLTKVNEKKIKIREIKRNSYR